jgi:S-adenosylmethionine/arginine decarboxylase-like enzyme
MNKPPTDENKFSDWMLRLIDALDMELFMGPYVKYSSMDGNQGLTGVAVISTSSITAHFWDAVSPGLGQIDVYSCKDVNPEVVFGMLQEFEPVDLDYLFIDRDIEDSLAVVGGGKIDFKAA